MGLLKKGRSVGPEHAGYSTISLKERLALQERGRQSMEADSYYQPPPDQNRYESPVREPGLTLEEIMEKSVQVTPEAETAAISRTLEKMKKKFGDRIKTERNNPVFHKELWSAIEEALKDEGRIITNVSQRQSVTERTYHLIIGLGPLEQLIPQGYSEIMVSRYDKIFVEKQGKMCLSDVAFSSEQELRSVIERIVSPIGRTIDDMTPLVDGRLEDGSRFNAIIPPVAIDGAQLTIRRFPEQDLQEEDYLRYDSLDEKVLKFLKMAVKARLNLIVSGGTGSGKTSLLNLLGNFLAEEPGLAILTIEDSAELRIRHPNVRRYETRAATAEGKGEVTSRMLVKNSMRARPDIIIIGEIRDGTMADFLRAASSGHDGCMTTVHNNSPEELGSTVQILFQMAEDYNFTETAIHRLYANAVDLIIQIQRYPDHARRISKITHVIGFGKNGANRLGIASGSPDYNENEVYLRDIFQWRRTGGDSSGLEGKFCATGYVPEAIIEKAELYGEAIDRTLFLREGGDLT